MAPSNFGEEVLTRQYTILKALGRGSTGKVMLAQHRLTGATVAVKALLKGKKCHGQTVSEVDIMRMLRHPNIVSLLQVIETEQYVYLIMEVVEGEELHSLIKKAGCLKEDEARSLFIQLLSGIGYCHEEGIVHHDLKPDNVMVDGHGKVKIIDFGLGDRFRPGQKLERRCGAFQFMPPEVLLGFPYEGPKVDMWSLGVLLYYMVTGTVPYGGIALSELKRQVLKGKYDIPYHLSKDLRSLISQLLSGNERLRPNVWDILAHPWLTDRETMFNIHSDEENSFRCIDPKIITAMKCLGFQTYHIRRSIREKNFNECMASYLLLQQCQSQSDNRRSVHTTSINPGATPFPSIEDTLRFSLPPRRRASEPNLKSHVLPNENPDLKEREIHAPVIGKKTPTPNRGHRRSLTAPCIYLAKETLHIVEDTSSPTCSGSKKTSPGQSRTSTSSSPQPRGWAGFKRRIGSYILRLCCCISPHRKSPRKVYPQK
ncbi:sperm motility kinase Z-like [Sigmodon hispidus]